MINLPTENLVENFPKTVLHSEYWKFRQQKLGQHEKTLKRDGQTIGYVIFIAATRLSRNPMMLPTTPWDQIPI